MAANRFATMVHRNSNKITLILIYAVLEWFLIMLLLLNSLFSYLILKFADYFGLKPPCPWCTRIDHVLDSSKGEKSSPRDTLCEFHAREVSGLGFCSNHRKLVESGDMCEDCLSSRPEFGRSTRDFPVLKELGLVRKVGENGEVTSNCSCCGVSLVESKYSSYVLKCAEKDNCIADFVQKGLDSAENVFSFVDDLSGSGKFDDKNRTQACSELDGIELNGSDTVDVNEEEVVSEAAEEKEALFEEKSSLGMKDKSVQVCCEEDKPIESPPQACSELDGIELNGCDTVDVNEQEEVVSEAAEEKEALFEEKSNLGMKDKSVQVFCEEDKPIESPPQHLDFFLDFSGHKLVPVELDDSVMNEEQKYGDGFVVGEDQEFSPDCKDQADEKEEVVVESGIGSGMEEADAFLDVDINEEPNYETFHSMGLEEDASLLVFHAKESECENSEDFPLARWPSREELDFQNLAGTEKENHSDVHRDDLACEGVVLANNENEVNVSIGTEIPDIDITDELQIRDSISSNEYAIGDHSATSDHLHKSEDDGPSFTQADEDMAELPSLSVHGREQQEMDNTEEDKVPDTPTSVDSIHNLHKKLLMLGKRDSGAEESLDESVTSELESSDGVVSIEQLKLALRSERKALRALYAELEEERSASAVAANQTMAMINRLQEEKAAMQMEALQYQRMMEEQSEYDQEALQLLNELMVKREKEKQELEKELERLRRKFLDYEMKDKVKRSKDGSTRCGFSSASCSNAEDSDGLSLDLNQEAKEDEDFYNHGTPVDAVVNLEESLADFEDERLSILEQLKVLEEKLMTQDDGNEQHFEDEENGHANVEANGHANGLADEMANVKLHHRRKIPVQMGKSLLPLFDAISDENGNTMPNGNGIGSNRMHGSHKSKPEMQNGKLVIEEEVDHLYARLQALEADREFLKHCIRSLKKGDKGVGLLQEILHHLRDLRHVELRARNFNDQ